MRYFYDTRVKTFIKVERITAFHDRMIFDVYMYDSLVSEWVCTHAVSSIPCEWNELTEEEFFMEML